MQLDIDILLWWHKYPCMFLVVRCKGKISLKSKLMKDTKGMGRKQLAFNYGIAETYLGCINNQSQLFVEHLLFCPVLCYKIRYRIDHLPLVCLITLLKTTFFFFLFPHEHHLFPLCSFFFHLFPLFGKTASFIAHVLPIGISPGLTIYLGRFELDSSYIAFGVQ